MSCQPSSWTVTAASRGKCPRSRSAMPRRARVLAGQETRSSSGTSLAGIWETCSRICTRSALAMTSLCLVGLAALSTALSTSAPSRVAMSGLSARPLRPLSHSSRVLAYGCRLCRIISLHTGSSPIVASSAHLKAYGARRLGPDLTVTCRANQHFNLEVTRLRAIGDPGNATGRFESGIPRRSDQSSGPSRGRATRGRCQAGQCHHRQAARTARRRPECAGDQNWGRGLPVRRRRTP